MEKKQYIFPVVDVTLLRTKELMTFTDPSNQTPDEPGAAGAPRKRWTDVF
jgi:hypothetical protein